ncbi:DMT family transporter [Bosea sp. CS1GBMeth4]|uniref:DMT family transporter n=1 Tax=Bosea sp. CS1GBMeth4 TaxID=1892849 RepID=UPI0016485AAA|nr:DMT family transporter [Bosea sp. CS1GBMeth4]
MAEARNTVQAGILWMILSTAFLAGGNSLVRLIATELHPFQISFLTNLIMLVFVWPQLRGDAALPDLREKRKLYGLMTAIGCISNLTWFYALAHVPLAKATALTFAAPIIVTALAGVLLGETVSRSRWAAVLVGFVGVMVISRPGFVALDGGTVALMISTLSMASGYLISKRLTQIERMSRIVAVTTLIPVVTGLTPAVLYWRTPSLDMMLFLVAMAVAMFVGRLTLFLALRNAPASTVMPFDFARLPFVALFAWLAYREIPDRWVLVGAAIVMGATLFIFQEEQRKRRQLAA